MELHITGLWYAFPYQNMEFHITKILKEIIADAVTDKGWERELFAVEDMQWQRAAAPQQCMDIQSMEVSWRSLNLHLPLLRVSQSVIDTDSCVVSFPTLRIRSVIPAATVWFVATADRICSVNDEDESQQSFGDFGGGLEQFWVTFRPQGNFLPREKRPKKPILCQKSSKWVKKLPILTTFAKKPGYGYMGFLTKSQICSQQSYLPDSW